MKIFFLYSMALGAMVVCQPAINRLVLADKGLAFAVFLNAVVVFAAASAFLLMASWSPFKMPQLFYESPTGAMHWWFILPGIFGFLLIASVPIMMKNLGALPTMTAMLLGQMATSMIWDMSNGTTITFTRIGGLVLTTAGAYLTFKEVSDNL